MTTSRRTRIVHPDPDVGAEFAWIPDDPSEVIQAGMTTAYRAIGKQLPSSCAGTDESDPPAGRSVDETALAVASFLTNLDAELVLAGI